MAFQYKILSEKKKEKLEREISFFHTMSIIFYRYQREHVVMIESIESMKRKNNHLSSGSFCTLKILK